MMISNRSNLVTAYFPSLLNSNHRQRSSNRSPKVLTIKTSNIFFNEIPILPMNHQQQQQINKRNLDRQSPLLVRRPQHSTMKSLLPNQQPSDIDNILGNHIALTNRDKSPRTSSLYSSTVTNNKKTSSARPIRSKSQSLKSDQKYYLHEQIERKNSIPDLFISSARIHHSSDLFNKTTVKDLVDEWEDPKSNVAVISDEIDSMTSPCNSPSSPSNPSTCIDPFELVPNVHISRRTLTFALTPVVEDIDN